MMNNQYVFVLAFEHIFKQNELQSLVRLQQVFEKKLPVFKEIKSFNVKIEGDVVRQEQELSGVLFQEFNNNSQLVWELKIEKNTITVSCFAENNWQKLWNQTQDYLLRTMKVIESESNRLMVCALKIVNKFLNENNQSVFSLNTPYLTPHVLNGNVGRLWHIHQGWFEQLENQVYLHTLNLSVSDENAKMVSTVVHNIQCQFIKTPLAIIEFKETLMELFFLKLHHKNKKLLTNLLTQEQLERME